MPHFLNPHPDTHSSAVRSLSAEASRPDADTLRLCFTLAGAIERLLIPAPAAPERTDGLWQHSCFEAFVMAGEGPAYHEINLSPSGQWAVYRFDSRRAGMAPAEIPSLHIHSTYDDNRIRMEATLTGFPPEAPWRIGLAAVIEEKDGKKSYWALAHPPGDPDFHHRDCFALRLPPAA